jgi:uroporphyrinogen decarboxylase
MPMNKSRFSHKDRILALLSNQTLDRQPIALWRHFPVDDQDPQSLSLATLNFQNTYDFDLVKVTPASSYCLKDWGAEDRWEGNPEGTRRYTQHVIKKPEDWETLTVIHPQSRFLQKQLDCLATLRKQLGPDTPLLQTIFNPLAQAKNLAGGETLLVHLRLFPDSVLQGLKTITRSIQMFIDAAGKIGIDGIFYAVQHAQAGLLTRNEYEKFGKFFDSQVLENSSGLWCNMLHLHGKNVYFDLVTDYPVNIINWHDLDTPPSLLEASRVFNGILCGGLKRETVSLGSPGQIQQEIHSAISQVKGLRLLVGTGCVLPTITPFGNILAARQGVEMQ